MYKVKIITGKNDDKILRQTKGGCGVSLSGKYKFYINDDSVTEADFVVVRNKYVKKEMTLKVAPENVILLTSEPKNIVKFPQKYLNQFGMVWSCQQELKHRNAVYGQAMLPWWVGIKDRGEVSRESINYDTLSTEELPNKTKLISVITSNKAFTKGHRERIEFVRKLKKHYGDRIDVYGRGFNGFEDKWDVLAPYKYHIAIENSSEKYYWTEKLSDCYLTGTFPIYYGCRNIGEYFDEKSYARIDINNFENAVKTIDEILGEDLYEQRRNALIESKRMVLDKYNIFEEIAWCCDRLNPEAEKKTIKLKPYKMEFSLKNFYSYAVSRNIQKLIYSLTKLS